VVLQVDSHSASHRLGLGLGSLFASSLSVGAAPSLAQLHENDWPISGFRPFHEMYPGSRPGASVPSEYGHRRSPRNAHPCDSLCSPERVVLRPGGRSFGHSSSGSLE